MSGISIALTKLEHSWQPPRKSTLAGHKVHVRGLPSLKTRGFHKPDLKELRLKKPRHLLYWSFLTPSSLNAIMLRKNRRNDKFYSLISIANFLLMETKTKRVSCFCFLLLAQRWSHDLSTAGLVPVLFMGVGRGEWCHLQYDSFDL